MSETKKRNNHISFLPALGIFAVACFIRYSRSYMSTYYTTLFALNYDYGFIPQGFLGWIYREISLFLPWEMQNYTAVFNFSGFCTILYFVILFVFFGVCLNHCPTKFHRNMKHFIVFLSIFAFPMFMSSTNFGSVYLYFSILTLLCLILIIIEKYECFIILFGIIGMCIHEDFLFACGGIILLSLLYKILFVKEKYKIFKYSFLFALFLISTVGLLIYFEYYSQFTGDLELIAEEIKTNAKLLSKSASTYNPIIIKHDILGQDRTPLDVPYLNYNVQDFPVFCILFAPYIFYGFQFFVGLIQHPSLSKKQRFWYLSILLGGLMMLPLFLFKTEFGVYMFYVFFYYIGMLILGLVMQDHRIDQNFNELKIQLKQITPVYYVWLLYPFILTPFKGVTISTQIHDLAEILFTELTFFLPLQ